MVDFSPDRLILLERIGEPVAAVDTSAYQNVVILHQIFFALLVSILGYVGGAVAEIVVVGVADLVSVVV